MKIARFLSLTVAFVVLVYCVVSTPDCMSRNARADLPTVEAIRTVQPAIEFGRAERLARTIDDSSRRHNIPAALIVSIIFHESSFREEVESREIRGARGETGLMQLAPHGAWRDWLPDGCETDLEGAECQIETGVAYLSECRRLCPGSPYRWVALYGSGRCPTEEQAGMSFWVRSRIRMFVSLGGGW